MKRPARDASATVLRQVPGGRGWVVGLLLAAAAVLATLAWRQHLARQQWLRGQGLFMGVAALPGRLSGHALALPTEATRCINCHASDHDRPEAAALGPALTSQRLAGLQSRRGAPPSRFDAASLCRALRTGVDPAQVLLPTAMPRYAATEAHCADLWAYLAAPR